MFKKFSRKKTNKKSKWNKIIISCVSGMGIIIFLAGIFAALTSSEKIPIEMAKPISIGICLLGGLTCGFIGAKLENNRQIKQIAAKGGIFLLLMFLIGIAVGGGKAFSAAAYIMYIAAFTGCILGGLSTGKKKKRRN